MTNANLPALAETIATARKGFTGLIIKKTGVTRGGKKNPVVYGDDTVHAVVITGFKYPALVGRSMVKAEALTDADLVAVVARGLHGWERVWKKSDTLPGLKASCEALGLDDTGKKADLVARLEAAVPGGMRQVPVTRADVDAALVEVKADLQRFIDGETEPTNAHVFEPLMVEGEKVRGCRVYVGPTDDTQEPAAPKGTVYLQGLMIGQKVLTPAANGPVPESKSAPTQVAKKALRNLLPVGRYVSYKLEPAVDGVHNWILNVGGVAAQAAVNDGVVVTDRATQQVIEAA